MGLIGWVGVGIGGTYGCRCGILYAPVSGVVFYSGLVSLTSSYPSPCSSELIVIGGVFLVVCLQGFATDKNMAHAHCMLDT